MKAVPDRVRRIAAMIEQVEPIGAILPSRHGAWLPGAWEIHARDHHIAFQVTSEGDAETCAALLVGALNPSGSGANDLRKELRNNARSLTVERIGLAMALSHPQGMEMLRASMTLPRVDVLTNTHRGASQAYASIIRANLVSDDGLLEINAIGRRSVVKRRRDGVYRFHDRTLTLETTTVVPDLIQTAAVGRRIHEIADLAELTQCDAVLDRFEKPGARSLLLVARKDELTIDEALPAMTLQRAA